MQRDVWFNHPIKIILYYENVNEVTIKAVYFIHYMYMHILSYITKSNLILKYLLKKLSELRSCWGVTHEMFDSKEKKNQF